MFSKRNFSRKLSFDRLEERTLLSISYPMDVSAVTVDGGTLHVMSINVDSLTVTNGGVISLDLQPAPFPYPDPTPVMDGGIVHYTSDVLPGLTSKDGAKLICTDPSTVTVDGGTLTSNYIPTDILTIDNGATVNLTSLPGNPVETVSAKNVNNDGTLNIASGNKTIGDLNGSGSLTVSAGATLTAASIVQDTITVGPGGLISLAPMVNSDKMDVATTATMDGGTLRYNTNAIPNVTAVNGAVLNQCNDSDIKNAVRTVEVIQGGDTIKFDPMAMDGTTISRDTDPSTWPPYDTAAPDTRTPITTTLYENRFGDYVAADYAFQDKAWDGTISNSDNLSGTYWQDSHNKQLFDDGSVSAIVKKNDEVIMTPLGTGTTGLVSVDDFGDAQSVTTYQDGVKQFTFYPGGGVEYNGEMYTSLDNFNLNLDASGNVSNIDLPESAYSGPIMYVSGGSKNVNKFYLGGFGTKIKGDEWGQLAQDSFGCASQDPDGTIHILCGLFGNSEAHHYSCNTMVLGGNGIGGGGNQHAGNIQAVVKWSHYAQVRYLVQAHITSVVTSNDCSTRDPLATVHWSITGPGREAEGGTSVGPYNPLTGKYRNDSSDYYEYITVNAVYGKEVEIIRITPTMQNHGSGNVTYVLTFKISQVWHTGESLAGEISETPANETTPQVSQNIPILYVSATLPIRMDNTINENQFLNWESSMISHVAQIKTSQFRLNDDQDLKLHDDYFDQWNKSADEESSDDPLFQDIFESVKVEL